MKSVEFKVLLGQTITSISLSENKDRIEIETAEGKKYLMHHLQDCCETVTVEDIIGDLQDLVGNPITLAEERVNPDGEVPQCDESCTWTFYELATVKGYVTIRWLGSSNGYYSERVDFEEMAN